MADRTEEPSGEVPLSERVLDLLVFVPAGIVASVVEELPKLAERGRSRLEVRVNSARAVGEFAFKAGHRELRRRSDGLRQRGADPSPPPPADRPEARYPIRTIPRNPPPRNPSRAGAAPPSAPAPVPGPSVTPGPGTRTASANGHVPEVGSLAIPGFDTLSASQVVQRLDGLTRTELVSVRAYETATRRRRTILSRVDQLLDERS
jgi:hypothetical protein